MTQNWWIGNDDAPNCGCQLIIDPFDRPEWNYINKICKLSFPYARDWGYGKPMSDSAGNIRQNYDPHFVQVSTSFAVGREYRQFTQRDGWQESESMTSEFVFTGFETVSNPNVLDIVVFYHETDCMRHEKYDQRGSRPRVNHSI